jgi:hypothetical protein
MNIADGYTFTANDVYDGEGYYISGIFSFSKSTGNYMQTYEGKGWNTYLTFYKPLFGFSSVYMIKVADTINLSH